MNRILPIALILALSATGAQAAKCKHHGGRHCRRQATQNAFSKDVKGGDLTINKKGDIIPAHPH
ncbi:MAG TPA: hypothetical protein VKQ54_07710 [Caulobacteraceae bacterium]|nr:hypothetical protein [Caulobacteraceae bacterium]